MAFFDKSKIQSYGVLNHDKQLQKSFPRMPEITPFRRKLFASTSGSQKEKYFVEVCSAACFVTTRLYLKLENTVLNYILFSLVQIQH